MNKISKRRRDPIKETEAFDADLEINNDLKRILPHALINNNLKTNFNK